MIESIPELRTAYLDAAVAGLERGGNVSWRVVERADLRLQGALWRQAVESHRWLRQDTPGRWGEAPYWTVWMALHAIYWAETGRCGWDESPTTEIALRDASPLEHRLAPSAALHAVLIHRCWSAGCLTVHVYALGEGYPGDACICGEVTAGDEFEEEW